MVASRLRQARLARFVDRGEELSKFQAFIRVGRDDALLGFRGERAREIEFFD